MKQSATARHDYECDENIDWPSLAVLLNRLASAFQFGDMRKRMATEEQWEEEREHYEVLLPREFMRLKAIYLKNRNRYISSLRENDVHKDTMNAIENIIAKEAETVLLGDEDGSES